MQLPASKVVVVNADSRCRDLLLHQARCLSGLLRYAASYMHTRVQEEEEGQASEGGGGGQGEHDRGRQQRRLICGQSHRSIRV